MGMHVRELRVVHRDALERGAGKALETSCSVNCVTGSSHLHVSLILTKYKHVVSLSLSFPSCWE